MLNGGEFTICPSTSPSLFIMDTMSFPQTEWSLHWSLQYTKALLTVQSQAELLNVSEPWLPYFENSYNITYQSTVHRVVVKINKKI